MHNRLVNIGSPPASACSSRLASCWLLLSLCLWACAGVRSPVKISSNYNASVIHSLASIAVPLEVPLSIPKHYDPNPVANIPINEKYSIGLYRPSAASLDLPGLQERMVHVDYQMIYEENPPNSVFEERYNEEYHLLQIREFFINIANPSEVFTICINEIFSDCESIKKMLKKPLPLCINPFTKYPIYFNLYATHFKNREMIKSSIFFNVTLRHDSREVFNRVWMRELKFNLFPNHLKLLPFEIRNCDNENTVIAIKNPEKFDLSFLLIHKYKKYHTNGQPLDDKFTIGAQKTFRFMLEAKDSTMTIYSKPLDSPDKSFPVLYVPIYCFDRVVLENIPVGIISSPNLALAYPILVTSNTNHPVQIEEISLSSSNGAVELIRSPSFKTQIQAIERYVQVASFIVRSTSRPSFKNSITIKLKYSLANSQSSNNSFQARKTASYVQLEGAIGVGENRYYQVSKLPEKEYNDTEKVLHFNYSVANHLQLPVRMERILFNSQKFKMHWFRYTGLYIFPQRVKEEIMLEYVGPRQIPISPLKYAAAIEFSGGIYVPFEVMVFDRTLACLYQGKETRCSALKYINFGYQRNEQKVQAQTIVFRNFNPHNVTLSLAHLPNLTLSHGLALSLTPSLPFPPYDDHTLRAKDSTQVLLRSGHTVNMTIEMRILGAPLSGETLLNISTEYESFAPKIKFNFEEGRLVFTPTRYQISHFDRQHSGTLTLLSTFQDVYQIREVISDTVALSFLFNESAEYEPNQRVEIPFVYEPHRDENNLTAECCSEEFLKNYYLQSLIYFEDSSSKNHEVTVITNTDYQQHLTIHVDSQKAQLLLGQERGRKVSVSALSVGGKAKVCLQVGNPYSSALKFSVFFLPDAVIYKPKDYSDYFKHARRERIDAYICFVLTKKTAQLVNALKQMLRLEEAPTRVDISVDAMGNIDFGAHERDNLSSNEYVSAMVQTGEEACYKIHTMLYFKLLIESEVVNALLDRHSLDVLEKFIEKEWEHMQNNSVSYMQDDFYSSLSLHFQDYCKSAFFPIFRFCLHYPIALLNSTSPLQGSAESRKGRQSQPQLLQPNSTEQVCFVINNQLSSRKQASFELVIANNYSKYDDYKVEVALVEPKVSVSTIGFEREHRITHQTFIKHYFSALARASPQELLKEGVDNKHRLIPVYLTNQDYEQDFGLFRGDRFFEIENHAPIDIDFTHFGFENRENISEWAGLRVEAVGQEGPIRLTGSNKTVFKLSLRLDQPFQFNLSNPYFHKKVHLYLYKDEQFHLSLTLLLRVADNVVQKLKLHSQPASPQASHIRYFLLNFLSVAFILLVISHFRKEEADKMRKMQIALEKQKKIVPHKKEGKEEADNGFVQEKLKKKTHILLPESIGSKLKPQEQQRFSPQFIISEEELAYFKSLKVEKDRSVVSQSSEDPFLRLSNEQAERSEQKSQTNEKDFHQQQESKHSQSNDLLEDPSYYSQQSQQSLSQSILPDGISVCNQQLDTLDEFEDFEFGFESKRSKKEEKEKKEEQFGYYDVFSNHNPLKKEKVEAKENPFPWMNLPDKKKAHRPKRSKQEPL